MTTSLLHQKIQDEIRGIPEGKTRELYELVHQFRLKSQTPKDKAAEILRLAGSWADMPKEEFSSFCSEIRDRRHRAGSQRRHREAGLD